LFVRFLTFCAIVALGTFVPFVASAGEQTILVPAGTDVPIHVLGDVSSRTAHEGDRFQIQTARDVVVHGLVVIPADSDGEGQISAVGRAGGNGHSGSLELHFNWVHSADGGKIRLRDTSQKQTEDDRAGAKSTATIIGVATLGIGGLFGHNFAHGKEVVVDPKSVLNAFVASNIHVRASTRAAAEEQYDH
jgi:hypothetical protein